MAAPTGSLYSTHSARIEEIISKSIGMFMPALSPVWRNTIVTNQGVGKASEFGRDWKIIKVFMGSLAGVIDQGGPLNDFPLYGDNQDTLLGSKVHLKNVNQVFPDAFDGPNASPFTLGIPMRSMVTNLPVTLGELQADVTSAFIGQVMAPKMEGFAKNLALMLCNYFYLSQNDYYRISYLGGGSGTGWDKTVATNAELMVDTTYSNYACERFFVGQRVQFYDSTGATLRQTTAMGADTVFIVVRVDPTAGKVWFRPADGTADVNTASFADDDVIVFAKSKGSSTTPYAASPYFTGIAGINSWLKTGTGSNDNYLLGAERDTSNAIDVTEHPEFKSLLHNNSSDPLTELTLKKVLRRWHVAKAMHGHEIDCFLASDGVWLEYEKQLVGRQREERRNKLATLRKGQGSDNGDFDQADILFTMDGRTYSGYTDPFVESGTVYGIKKGGGNWKRYSPPDASRLKKAANIPDWIPFRFVASALTGTDTNQMPVYSTSTNNRTLPTEGAQMPGMLRMQLIPDQPTGIKITNVAEDRLYASTS